VNTEHCIAPVESKLQDKKRILNIWIQWWIFNVVGLHCSGKAALMQMGLML